MRLELEVDTARLACARARVTGVASKSGRNGRVDSPSLSSRRPREIDIAASAYDRPARS